MPHMGNHTVTPPPPTPTYASRPTSPGTIPKPPPGYWRKTPTPPGTLHCRAVTHARSSSPGAESSMWTNVILFGIHDPQHSTVHGPLPWNQFRSRLSYLHPGLMGREWMHICWLCLHFPFFQQQHLASPLNTPSRNLSLHGSRVMTPLHLQGST